MKQCPQCGQVYVDESLNFCLTDGAPLNPDNSQATVVIPEPQPLPPPKKKSRALLWAGIAVLVILLGIVGVAGLLMFLYSGTSGNVNNQNRTNMSPSPKTSATPKSTPSPSPTSTATPETSPTDAGTRPAPQSGGIDEVTPIAWGTSAGTFKGNPGQIYKFQCPPKGTAGSIWGSDIYTMDSSICTAAVHAGVITLDKGGVVTVEFKPGRSLYGSTERNGITSNPFGEYGASFVVR